MKNILLACSLLVACVSPAMADCYGYYPSGTCGGQISDNQETCGTGFTQLSYNTPLPSGSSTLGSSFIDPPHSSVQPFVAVPPAQDGIDWGTVAIIEAQPGRCDRGW